MINLEGIIIQLNGIVGNKNKELRFRQALAPVSTLLGKLRVWRFFEQYQGEADDLNRTTLEARQALQAVRDCLDGKGTK